MTPEIPPPVPQMWQSWERNGDRYLVCAVEADRVYLQKIDHENRTMGWVPILTLQAHWALRTA